MSNDNLYIIALLFILVSSLAGDKIQSLFSDKVSDEKMLKIWYSVILALVFSLIYFIFLRNSVEPFFFTVSKCNPKCSGGYYGKPATFQFTQLSPNGTTCSDQNCGYGMISECDHPECKNILSKYGGSNDLNSLQPSQ